MSYADDLDDYAFECMNPMGINGDEWKTKDGKKIKLSEMSDCHLKNCYLKFKDTPIIGDNFERELRRRKIIQ